MVITVLIHLVGFYIKIRFYLYKKFYINLLYGGHKKVIKG